MNFLLLRLLPKNLLSRLMGVLADQQVPALLLQAIIHIYAHVYKIRLSELKKPLREMRSFNDFFTRELKKELRPIDPTPHSITSPVDGTVAEHGSIKQGLLVQTKGILYSLNDLVGDQNAQLFESGYFMTIYLSPADYHRIHTPVAGQVKKFSYFSGNLWPVNSLGVNNVGGLFSLNERILTPIESPFGTVGIVKVGATVVGKIKLKFHSLTSNQGKASQINLPVLPARNFQKGEELGRFQLGSTVILLFQKDQMLPKDMFKGKKLKMGQVIGTFNKVMQPTTKT
ncbi:MAG: phosphatidylserine decarboxylase [SAR324 cluster bacterium]|uniref:Phosphatidylserine decarboxylase proenzyme n=1 Tax=SAR324 cluster bacterium TaxID=2024889 RepID=A0A2A4TBH9_9DELT|nr:MAG: phosphatidylserine decarboxylase [SAR324 cluster bacterium]